MKILNREQGLDDGRIIYEQDLIVARLQQDPPRNVAGTVYDFVAEGIAEQAAYLKAYHDVSHQVMTDPSDKNLMNWRACRSSWITWGCGSWIAVSTK